MCLILTQKVRQSTKSADTPTRSPAFSGLIEVLISEKQLDPDQPATDPWQHPFRMQCTPDEVTVSSFGPDGMFGTADDIAVPRDAQPVVK